MIAEGSRSPRAQPGDRVTRALAYNNSPALQTNGIIRAISTAPISCPLCTLLIGADRNDLPD
ncbi:MAG: hypothetical protein JO015_20755 [Verrucomicrobia bacterium]|nr:hypothetical protein [Verrucomicrobiota bacterium]